MRSREASVLYDNPGPRARRITLIGSVVFGVLALAGIYTSCTRRWTRRASSPSAKWAPLVDPSNENFNLVWQRIGEGFQNTLIAAALAIVASLVLGTGLAVLRIRLSRPGPRASRLADTRAAGRCSGSPGC